MNGFFLKNIFHKICAFIKSCPVLFSFLAGGIAKSAFSSGEHVIALVISVELFYFILSNLYSTRSYCRALVAGYAYGLSLYGGILYWETYLHDYSIGEFSQALLTILFYLASIAYVAFFFSIATYLSIRLAFNKLSLLVLWSIFITLAEILQNHLCSGYPFTIIAYGTSGIPYFPNIATVFGSYGVTFLFLFIIALLNVKRTFIVGLVTFGAVIAHGFYTVQYKDDYIKQENTFLVTVVQPNLDDDDRGHRDNCNYIAELADVNKSFTGKRLIITPETIILCNRNQIRDFQQAMLKNNDTYAMTGFIEKVKHSNSQDVYGANNTVTRYNAVHVYTPKEPLDMSDDINSFKDVAFYRKKHLIPFGEFFPSWFLFIAQFLPDFLTEDFIDESNENGLKSGTDRNTIKLSGIDPFDMNICYDIVPPGESMDDPLLSSWMVNVINLHNYCSTGISDIAHQQNVICRFRAIEFGKPIAVCANFGHSCFIDCNGGIIKKLSPDKKGAIHQKFPLKYRLTTFCKYKNFTLYFVFVLLFIMLFVGMMLQDDGKVKDKKSKKTYSRDGK